MSLPRWMEPLLAAEEMRATDKWAIETKGIPSLDLMERAGEGLALACGCSRCNIGKANPAVLPVPVCAPPMTSRPAMTTGMACAWMGVGVV